MHEEELTEHLYSKNDEAVRVANKALGMAIGAKFATNPSNSSMVNIRSTIDNLSRRVLIDTETVLASAVKHYDYLTSPARSLARVFNIGAVMGWGSFYTQHDIEELDEHLDIVDTCFNFVNKGLGS